MTNYEKYKDKIDTSFEENAHVAINKNTNEITYCSLQKCSDCLFSSQYNNNILCRITAMKWLVSEYKEPKIDWSKVPIDTPVFVSDDEVLWYNRYFAGVDHKGDPVVYRDGRTSWSNKTFGRIVEHFYYIELAEVSDE